jgi:Lar family restriction alleviation protein
MIKLERCPFCGSEKAVFDPLKNTRGEVKHFRGQCQTCLASSAWFDTEEEAAAAWNMRDVQSSLHTSWEKRFSTPGDRIVNDDLFILGEATYTRNPQTGNCYVYPWRGNEKARRVSRRVFMEMYQSCEKKIAGENKAHGGKHKHGAA